MYGRWYEKLSKRDLRGTIQLGEAYLREFPQGKFAGFVKNIIGFATASLDTASESRRREFRRLILSSLEKASGELETLMDDILNGRAGASGSTNDGQTPLMLAAARGDSEKVAALLSLNVPIDQRESSRGWTALVYAIWSGKRPLVQEL
jgi:ankyrin repeat protein